MKIQFNHFSAWLYFTNLLIMQTDGIYTVDDRLEMTVVL